jgi:CheY-like chemotaxis protein
MLAERIVGQPAPLDIIIPCIQMYRAGLAPEGRPAGVFLLLGPTGTGKTRTVEAIAEILHGTDKAVLTINCGEFQMDHEVAKLIGAPPGYIGHSETRPMLTQRRLAAGTSENCDLAIVLFDEIEKAAPSLVQLLLGILDRATLKLGDNSPVNFEKSIIFMTSNLGAKEMMREMRPEMGFQAGVAAEKPDVANKLESIATAAVRRKFSPEFVNRIDALITYQPLDSAAFSGILDKQIAELQRHVKTRLQGRCFTIEVSQSGREFLLRKGTSQEYGVRELKRTIHRNMTQPLATMVAEGSIAPGATVYVEESDDREGLTLRVQDSREEIPLGLQDGIPRPPVVLLVDDNRDLLRLFHLELSRAGWMVHQSETAHDAEQLVEREKPDIAVIDYLLPQANGVKMARAIHEEHPEIQIIIVTGWELSGEDEDICQQLNFPILGKPFLTEELTGMIQTRLPRRCAAGSTARQIVPGA